MATENQHKEITNLHRKVTNECSSKRKSFSSLTIKNSISINLTPWESLKTTVSLIYVNSFWLDEVNCITYLSTQLLSILNTICFY